MNYPLSRLKPTTVSWHSTNSDNVSLVIQYHAQKIMSIYFAKKMKNKVDGKEKIRYDIFYRAALLCKGEHSMNIINIEHIDKIFGDKVIFHDASLGIQQGDKIGIIGINGTGKSTLLKIIAGEEEPDTGEVIYQNGLKTLYLPQNPEFPGEGTLESYALKGDPQIDWQGQNDLNILGLTDLDIPLAALS